MTPSTKPEVHNTRIATPLEDDRATAGGDMHRKLGEMVFEIRQRTEKKQTNRNTHASQCYASLLGRCKMRPKKQCRNTRKSWRKRATTRICCCAPCINRSISPTRRTHSSKPAAAAGERDRQRTDGHHAVTYTLLDMLFGQRQKLH